MAPDEHEKRKYERLHVHCLISFAVDAEDGVNKSDYMDSLVKDICAEGVAFESPKKLKAGQVLVLKFKFPLKPVLKLKGTVMHCDGIRGFDGSEEKYSVGVKFLKPAEELVPLFLKFF